MPSPTHVYFAGAVRRGDVGIAPYEIARGACIRAGSVVRPYTSKTPIPKGMGVFPSSRSVQLFKR